MTAAATRQHIVEEADRLFYEHGFEATSLAHIAAAVQIARGNFYYHFRTTRCGCVTAKASLQNASPAAHGQR